MFVDLIKQTRQHHALEHATIHRLAAHTPHIRVAGYSDPLGFTLLGRLNIEEVRRAVEEALTRLQAGEAHWAIHPNCGTNLVTSGLLVTLAALLGNSLRQHWLDRFTTALLLVIPALIWSRPLGNHLQAYTTLARVDDRQVAAIHPVVLGNIHGFRVVLK